VAAAPPQAQPWPVQRLRARRGHDFYPPADSVPPLDSTADTPLEDTVIVAHYFVGGSDWWIVEADPATGVAFGYARLGVADTDAERGYIIGADWGYISLTELEGLQVGPMNMVVERDLDWTPRTVKEADLPRV